METRIAYGDIGPNNTSLAYTTLDDGVTWGPLFCDAPDDPFKLKRLPPTQIDLKGNTLEDILRQKFSYAHIETPVLHGSQYYPRIWRGGQVHYGSTSSVPRVNETRYYDSFIGSLEQTESLFESLTRVFRVVHPAPDNLNAYGGAIRDLIILGCTEVEAQWKGVLKANNFAAPSDRYNTLHYVKLCPVMRLSEYKVRLIRYPRIPEIAPFANWNADCPTQSLDWYDVYNSVKHDREKHYSKATLQHAINSIAACVVMLAAQFGEKTLRSYRFNNLFQFTGLACWEYKYWSYGPIPNVGWQEVNCPI